jgi:hypothetical protein
LALIPQNGTDLANACRNKEQDRKIGEGNRTRRRAARSRASTNQSCRVIGKIRIDPKVLAGVDAVVKQRGTDRCRKV